MLNSNDQAENAGATPKLAVSVCDEPNRRLTFVQRIAEWILGTDSKQRGYLKMLLMTAWVYVVGIGLMYFGVTIEIFNKREIFILAGCCITSTTIFYAIMRSGFNKRFSSPTLALPQTLVAQTWIVLGYGITGAAHGIVPIVLALVMVFGMFNMPAHQARLVALYTTVLLGLTMWFKCTVDPQMYVPKLEFVSLVLVATVLLSISQLAAKLNRMNNRLKVQKQELEKAVAYIQAMAIHDELTGLFNRRHLRQTIEEHIRRKERGGQDFYVALLDLDHFKHINDHYGHHVGDEVLNAFAALVTKRLRSTDIFGRWGGEEFLLLFLDPIPEHATLCLSQLHSALLTLPVCTVNPDLRITFSAGITKYLDGETADATIARADKGLYEAKAAGRNQTILL